MADIRLGRLPAPDDRDRNFPLSAAPRKLTPKIPFSRTWCTGPVLDQGQTPMCVGFSWTQWLRAAPVKNKGLDGPEIYKEAQAVDEWAPAPHDGSSVRAGAKALTTDGYISAYHWASNIDEMSNWVLTQGPMVIGINWYEGMFTPDAAGLVTVSGNLAGGHAICVSGYSSRSNLFTLTNSWGIDWGKKGRLYLSREDMDRLVFSEEGESCTAVEIKVL